MDRSKYTVGWICGLSYEFIAAQAFLDERHESLDQDPNDTNDYTLGKMSGHNIVITCLPQGEYGTASTAAAANNMVRSFPNIRVGLAVGTGGGAPSKGHDIRLGDIVVGTPSNDHSGVIRYDLDESIRTQGFVRFGSLKPPPRMLQMAVASLRASHELEGHTLMNDVEKVLQTNPRLRESHCRPNIDDQLYKSTFVHSTSSNDCQSCGSDPSHVKQRRPRDQDDDDPAIHYGLIASENQIMKDALIRDKFAMERGVLCFDIGAAGIINRVPCLVIRGICDYSDSHKNKWWLGYAAMTAAAYSKALLHRVIPEEVIFEKSAIDLFEG